MIGAETFNKSANYKSKNIFKWLFPQDPHNPIWSQNKIASNLACELHFVWLL